MTFFFSLYFAFTCLFVALFYLCFGFLYIYLDGYDAFTNEIIRNQQHSKQKQKIKIKMFFSRKQNTLKGCCHLSKRNISFEMFIWWFGSVIWSICRWIHTHKQTNKMFVIHIITKRQHFKERQKWERENRIKITNEEVNQLNVGSFANIV